MNNERAGPIEGIDKMSVTYKNAPLVELVAELRWGGPALLGPVESSGMQLTMPRSKDELLYMQFGALISADGFTRFERVSPPGFPLPAGNVACRYRPSDPEKQAPLFQLGPGTFTANALPPYESWSKFQPFVRRGVTALLEAHTRAQLPPPPISFALVRYIDAFRNNLTGGAHIRDFLRDVMKIDLVLPPAITSNALMQAAILPTIQIAMPIRLGRLEIAIAEATHESERAILCDMSVLIQRDIGANVDAAIDALAEGRQVIHDTFRGLTKPIERLMEPIS